MDFTVFKDRLVAEGYADDTAYAKIAHDIVLKAVRDSGFHDNLTVKGGVVMSSLTDVVRRATMDMDLDFLSYPLANAAIRKFVSGMHEPRRAVQDSRRRQDRDAAAAGVQGVEDSPFVDGRDGLFHRDKDRLWRPYQIGRGTVRPILQNHRG